MKQPAKDSPLGGGRMLMTLAEAGERLGVCERTIRGHVDRGELVHIALGHGAVRRRRMIHPDDLRAFIDLMRRGGESAPPINVVGRPVRQRRRPVEPAPPNPGGFLERLAEGRRQKAEQAAQRGKARS